MWHKKTRETLVIDPCIPAYWQSFGVEYRYDDDLYHITIRNPNRVQTGVVRMTLDGRTVFGALALQNDAGEHWVDVVMGNPTKKTRGLLICLHVDF